MIPTHTPRTSPLSIATNYEQSKLLARNLIRFQPVVIGFDTETTIGRQDNPRHTSLLQLAIYDGQQYVCFLFQLYRIYQQRQKLPRCLIRILQSLEMIKVGVDLFQDFEGLRMYNIQLKGTIDLQHIARSMKIPAVGLNDLGKRFIFDFPGKSEFNRRWNWDGDLTDDQITYASNDARWSLMIYGGMLQGVNISTEQPIDPEKDRLEYQTWVENILVNAKTPVKFVSLVNRTASSYRSWNKRYTKREREERAQQLLNQFIEEQLFSWDEENQEFLPL